MRQGSIAGRPNTSSPCRPIVMPRRKLAILVYHILKGDLVYHDPGADAYDAHDRMRVLRRLRQRAQHLGFTLVDLKTGEVAEGTVS